MKRLIAIKWLFEALKNTVPRHLGAYHADPQGLMPCILGWYRNVFGQFNCFKAIILSSVISLLCATTGFATINIVGKIESDGKPYTTNQSFLIEVCPTNTITDKLCPADKIVGGSRQWFTNCNWANWLADLANFKYSCGVLSPHNTDFCKSCTGKMTVLNQGMTNMTLTMKCIDQPGAAGLGPKVLCPTRTLFFSFDSSSEDITISCYGTDENTICEKVD